MCNDVGEGSRCCAFYSVTGFVFTVSSMILHLILERRKRRPTVAVRTKSAGRNDWTMTKIASPNNLIFSVSNVLSDYFSFSAAVGWHHAANSTFSDRRHWGSRGGTGQRIWCNGNVFGLLCAVCCWNLVWFPIQGRPLGIGARVGISIEPRCADLWNIKLK